VSMCVRPYQKGVGNGAGAPRDSQGLLWERGAGAGVITGAGKL
jgi:hypothetical protein